MNIRKYWKRLLFSATTLFWASCGGDSENLPIAPHNNGSEQPSSSSVEAQTSSSAENSASSSEFSETSSSEAPSSSSEAVSSSSSEISSSSSSAIPTHKLASDTTVTCSRGYSGHKEGCFLHESDGYQKNSRIAANLKDLLKNNKTRTLEELSAIEDSLESIHEFEDAPVYGVTHCVRYTYVTSFHCSNGKIYDVHEEYDNPYIEEHNYLPKDEYMQEGNIIYSWDEYKERFISSSSESSSSAESPSPLCTKDDFASYNNLREDFYKTKADLVNNTKKSLSEDELKLKNSCLNNIHAKNPGFNGSIATKQICDGDTTVNPRYQAKLDSNAEYIQKQIDECMKEE